MLIACCGGKNPESKQRKDGKESKKKSRRQRDAHSCRLREIDIDYVTHDINGWVPCTDNNIGWMEEIEVDDAGQEVGGRGASGTVVISTRNRGGVVRGSKVEEGRGKLE